jgi:hypothetical protein
MTQTWSEVHDHYVELERPEMLALVDALADSRYAGGIYPWTSHLALNLARTQVEYPYFGPYLSILPLAHGFMELRYVDTSFEEKQWHRTVRGIDVLPRLERFFKEMNWFARYPRAMEPERRETR